MSIWYNELDPKKAAWLRELIRQNVIAPGEVDERSIAEIQPADLRGFTQCHFFAGIGVWSYALRLAGWPDDRPVWTGSCPCPSFSAAGKGKGFADPRHLWPHWSRLIGECSPPVIFGEQVASAIGHGWLDLIYVDLEAAAYSVGAVVLGACSVGAPHIRQRLYFCAHRNESGHKTVQRGSTSELHQDRPICGSQFGPECGGTTGSSAHAEHAERRTELGIDSNAHRRNGLGWSSNTMPIICDGCNVREPWEHRCHGSNAYVRGERTGLPCECPDCGSPNPDVRLPSNGDLQRSGEQRLLAEDCGTGDGSQPLSPRLERHFGDVRDWRGPGWLDPHTARSVAEAGASRGFWADCDWWHGRDGKYRPIEPGIFPLAHGAANRVLKLRGYGDAIVAEVAKEFIKAATEGLRQLSI